MFSKYLKTLMNGGITDEELAQVPSPLAQALALHEAGDNAAALPLFERARETEPLDAQALTALGKIYLEVGRYDDALARLSEALAFDARSAPLHYQLGEAHYGLEDYAEAQRYFERATTLDKDYTDAYIRIGMLQSELGRLSEATKSFERAIFLDRAAVVARYHLAQVCMQQEDYRRALTQLHLVKELYPDYLPVYALQGDIFQRLGDHRQALVEFGKAIELGGGSGVTYWQLANSQLALGEKPKALASYMKVIEYEPDHWPAYYHAAVLLEEAKRYAQAYDHYQAIAQIEEYQAVASEAVARIGSLLEEIAAQMAGEAPTGEA